MRSIHKLTLFSGWMQQQAGLVSSITFGGPYPVATEEQGAYLDAAEQVLVLSLRTAQRLGGTTHSAAAAAGVQLRSFSTYTVRSPAQLRALPAAALTQLELHHGAAWSSSLHLNSSSITAALAQLSGRRSHELSGAVGNDCIAAVGQLALLTNLRVNCIRCPAGSSCDLQQLPQQLQQLHLSIRDEGGAVRVVLGQLTALQPVGYRD
uniref:Uncharacterized protein n=1 Tax=Tetradesmus obliquus TaxID=3088 RepID=A0A383WJG3_TETOB|eukprot:jgi/Sobl393_1/9659/SZX77264.1